MARHIFLLEIGTEELPPSVLRELGESFAKNIKSGFKSVNIIYKKIIWFASSRRLAIQVIDILVHVNTITSCDNDINIDIDCVNKNVSFFKQCVLHDKNITLLLTNIVYNALIKLSIVWKMKWNEKNVTFIRPVRTVTMLLDDKIVLTSDLFGVLSNRIIKGHRFMGERKIIVDHAKNYEKLLLKNGFVIVNYEQRKKIIQNSVNDLAKKIGGVVNYTSNLLEEVTGLSEWPVVLFGSFNQKFLSLPYEILLHIMIVKKKYFPVYDINMRLLPYFIFVIDIIPPNTKKIVVAHEKVLYSHFFDARNFLNYDYKCRLEDYLARLKNVLFYKKLGSLYDKTMRIKMLSSWIAKKIGIDVCQTERAAILSKCDLLSSMVSEFPFSQGIMGMYYARRDGELEDVALAQKEQYQPRFFLDSLPSTLISCTISIADKIDTISGMFMIGGYLKGSGDPLSLRRISIGVLRILIEKKIKINLCDVLDKSLSLYEQSKSVICVKEDIINFMYRRLSVLYKKKGYSIDIIQATLCKNLFNLININERIRAVSDFLKLEESQLLFFIYKRIFNILKNVPELYKYKIKDSLFIEPEEVLLSEKLKFLHKEVVFMCSMERYYDVLLLLVTLYVPVSKFFDSVFIMSEDNNLRLNRLVLLYKAWSLLIYVMDTPHRIFDTYTNFSLTKKRIMILSRKLIL